MWNVWTPPTPMKQNKTKQETRTNKPNASPQHGAYILLSASPRQGSQPQHPLALGRVPYRKPGISTRDTGPTMLGQIEKSSGLWHHACNGCDAHVPPATKDPRMPYEYRLHSQAHFGEGARARLALCSPAPGTRPEMRARCSIALRSQRRPASFLRNVVSP